MANQANQRGGGGYGVTLAKLFCSLTVLPLNPLNGPTNKTRSETSMI